MKLNKYIKLYEIKIISEYNIRISFQTDRIIQPDIVTDFICRYHIRIAGIEPKLHTRQFILQELRAVYGLYHFKSLRIAIYSYLEAKKTNQNFTSVDIYEVN